jgi:hypothetical protein
MSDPLLEWISFRRVGQIKDVPPDLTGGRPPYRVMHDLAILGHIEFGDRTSWRVAPPVLAGLPSHRDHCPSAILCGARTQGVLADLSAACEGVDARMVVEERSGTPSVIRLTGRSKAILANVSSKAGVPFQNDASFTLLSCVPTISEWPRTPCPMVAGRVERVRRFSRSKVRWVESSLSEATDARSGFFRIKRDWDWVSILKTSTSECAYIDDRAGRLAVAAGLHLVSWDAGSRTLSMPHQIYPPIVISRALALCTGSLPQFDRPNRRISFGGVGISMQRLALAITGLRLA